MKWLALCISFFFVSMPAATEVIFPDVSENVNFCLKKLTAQTIHRCDCEPYNEEFIRTKPSYLKHRVKGRLGNKMFAYALLTALKHEHGYRVFMEGRDLEHLAYFFKNIDQVESLEVLCDEEKSYPWEHSLDVVPMMANDTMRFGRVIDYLYDSVLLARNLNRVLRWDSLMLKQEDHVKRAFQFKDKFLIGADRRIHRITKKCYDKNKWKKKKEIVYVGIHMRFRDAGRDIMEKYGLPELTASLYLRAMNTLVDKLESKKRKLIFLVVTDDPLTVHHYIMPRIRHGFNAFLAGTGHVNNRISVGLDMAILSRCNYTIQSYGTFSFWSGFLSGGPKILPYHMLQNVVKWDGDKPAMHQGRFYLSDIGVSALKIDSS